MNLRSIGSFLAVIVWVIGIVIAKGFWSTFFAIFVPLWAWYLAVEHFLRLWHLI
jgi:hypothetical protein